MKKTTTISLVITVLLIAIALLSLSECVTVTRQRFSPGMVDWGEEAEPIVEQARYAPRFVCVLTGLELLLLWAVKKRFACWLGLLLNLAATAGPWIVRAEGSKLAKLIQAIYTDIGGSTPHYTFQFPFHLILGLGCAVTVLYILLLLFRKTPDPGIDGGFAS